MSTQHGPESAYAWWRLMASLALMTVGGAGMYAVTVVLPAVQADFGVDRADASLPYTLTMLGFGFGGILMGRLADRFGVMLPVAVGAVGLGAGFVLAGLAGNLWLFCLAQGLLLGLLGTSATFVPLVADTSLWFDRRRGIAMAICMSGNYVAGAFWPPVISHFTDSAGWRSTYIGIGIFCVLTMLPLAWVYRRRPPALAPVVGAAATAAALQSDRPLGMSPAALQTLLSIAGLACCVAMAMPQVHIVAYCGDLGIGQARGAQMLSLMLGMGIVSRLVSGWIADRIGGLRTLLLGSFLQGVALFAFLFADGVVSLYLVSAMFGLFQGGIVPSYAIIVRETMPANEAATRVGIVIFASVVGMSFGGWVSGVIFDYTGSYAAAFANGFAWNLLNIGIVLMLLLRKRQQQLVPA